MPSLHAPLLAVLTFDPMMQQFYDRVEEAWSSPSAGMSRVTLVSIAGGERDVMVPAHLSIAPKATAISLAVSAPCFVRGFFKTLFSQTPAIPRNWASADHLAVVW